MITEKNYNELMTPEILAKMPESVKLNHEMFLQHIQDYSLYPELFQKSDIAEIKEHLKTVNEIAGKLSLNSISDNLAEIFSDENERSIARMFINQRTKEADISTKYILQMAAKMGISQPHVYIIRGKLIYKKLIPEDWFCHKINRGGRPKK